MSYQLVVHPQAEQEIFAAAQWYEKISPVLATDFLYAIDQDIEKMTAQPLLYQTIYKQKRRIILCRFPYALIFVIDSKTIVLIACIHNHRNPEQWRSRQ